MNPRESPAPAAGSEKPEFSRLADVPPSVVRFTPSVVRFTQWVRVVHWVNATLMLTLIATGSSLYIEWLSVRVGHRATVKSVHVWIGFALIAWWLIALLGTRTSSLRDSTRTSSLRDSTRTSSLRDELAELDRWTSADTAWLLTGGRLGTAEMGKFNAGQKLNAAVLGGLMVSAAATGLMLRWPEPFPDWIRTGATFVHDVSFLVTALLVAGHIVFAFAHPSALRAMVAGRVSSQWAVANRPGWAAQLGLTTTAAAREDSPLDASDGPVVASGGLVVASDDSTAGDRLDIE